ncbi:MAG: sigma-70 family RNA polymerase sigma factor [Ruminococcaceae bacterium]|nr:sigma-70 family RNA polymerase sigma factor [Oscillospiraceae bacterium]
MEDKRIIALFWARDERVLDVVREKYGKLCRRIAHNLLGNAEDVEECENDAYLALWNAIPPARPDSLSAYLGRVTRNIALDRFDRRNAQKRGGEMAELLPELCEVAGGSVEEAFDSTYTAELITAFLREETEEYRRLFLRRYWYGDSIAALAAGLGCGESTVKMRLARQRERLRKFLEKEGVSV